jgi:predicted O-methyltransferase YrrM
MTDAQHEEITAIMTSQGKYGTGVTPNPYASKVAEWERRKEFAIERALISAKIESLFEPRFITPPETSECIESLITMTDSRKILEIGTCTGFTTLHMLRAIIGKDGGHVTSIDSRPAHDEAWFSRPSLKPWFRFIQGWTPEILDKCSGTIFDLVFIDSDHSEAHCQKELAALIPITQPGTIFLFHDCPKRDLPSSPPDSEGTIFRWLHSKIDAGYFRGTVLPTAEQLDCLMEWGPGYDKNCNPGLGVFVRR